MAQVKRVPKTVAKVSKPVEEPIQASVEHGRLAGYDPRQDYIWNLAKEMLLKRVGQLTPITITGIREIAGWATALYDEVHAPF